MKFTSAILRMWIVLAATSASATFDLTTRSEIKNPETQVEYEDFVRKLEAVCEKQINEIAQFLPSTEEPALRKRHSSWKSNRDRQCEQTAEQSDDPLAKIRCLANATENYYQERELEIWNLEKKAKAPPR